MKAPGPLDSFPVWVLFLVTMAVVLLAFEGGSRLGRSHRRRTEQEDRGSVGQMVAATLALLAFIVAFTFGLAASRFDLRRSLVVDEANAIGTTYLRAAMLPEPHRAEVRRLLREYVAVNVEAARGATAAPAAAAATPSAAAWPSTRPTPPAPPSS